MGDQIVSEESKETYGRSYRWHAVFKKFSKLF